MSSRLKAKNRYKSSYWDKPDLEVLEATSETFRIEVDRAFQEFLADSNSKEYSFPATLTNYERKFIHQKSSQYNLASRSHGKDPNRILTIYKKRNKSNFESFYIDLSDLSKRELMKIQHCYEQTMLDKNIIKLSGCDKVFGKLSLGEPSQVRKPIVKQEYVDFQRQLPIYIMKDIIVEKIRNNRVIIVSSETGSGKTTQIPQYIMDDARSRGEKCRILCTQPRRISAVSVAERVSNERGSDIGDVVGYHIRLESKLGSHCNLIYCTNGVLIRSLMSGDRVLNSLTHVIIDEVHERDKLSDFLLICLRESLRNGGRIKLILMSATIDVEKFKCYFEEASILSVPGRLFSIKEIFLDEVLEMTGYEEVLNEKKNFFEEPTQVVVAPPPPSAAPLSPLAGLNTFPANLQYDIFIERCFEYSGPEVDPWAQMLQLILTDGMPVNYQHSQTRISPLMAAVHQNNVDYVEKLCCLGADPRLTSAMGFSALSLAEQSSVEEIRLLLNMFTRPTTTGTDLLAKYYKTVNDDDIDYELITRLIVLIHTQYNPGAILVFLPGYDDIMICYEHINETFLDKNTYRVFFLHGAMNIREQHEVFDQLDVRKIILSTNIAETSLTIDDVVYVIDSGKAKVQTYDSCSGLSSLQTQWISKACCKQRAGRAGRTTSGMCFHLFSRARYDSFLNERVPEILRVPLEELCLNTKTLAQNYSSIYNFLVMAPDPPSSNSVKTAIENLECLGALDSEENLTPLGEYLSQLTIEPHLGKMLIYSVIFKCLDPVLTIVASLAQKDPFQLPPQANLRSAAAEKRKILTMNTFSDHMVYLKAFIKWQDAVKWKKERNFCKDFFISSSTMETILKTRSQLLGQLRASKFVPANGCTMVNLNCYSENWSFVKAVISAGLYPKLAFKKNHQFCTRTEKKVLVHNASPLGKENVNLWLVYDEMIKARNGHQLRGVTPVTPLTISLMCGVKTTTPQENYLEIDEWLEFEFPDASIVRLRKTIEEIIERKMFCPSNSLSPYQETAIQVLSTILMEEDRAANMPIPTGIKQKPKFFDMNRLSDSVGNDWRQPDRVGNSHFTPRHNSSYGNRPQNNGYHHNRRAAGPKRYGGGGGSSGSGSGNGNVSYANNFSGDSKNEFQQKNLPHPHPHHLYNGDSNYFTSNSNYQMPQSSTNNCILPLPSPPAVSQFLDLEGAVGVSGAAAPFMPMGMRPSTSTQCYGQDNNAASLWGAAFILIRVKQEHSIKIAYETSEWTFSPQTEKQIISLDNVGVPVYLIYTVNRMNNIYGIAKFITLNRHLEKLSSLIEWQFKLIIPYRKVYHLKNNLNNNRCIYDGSDGQMVSSEAGLQLWEVYKREQGRPVLRRTQN